MAHCSATAEIGETSLLQDLAEFMKIFVQQWWKHLSLPAGTSCYYICLLIDLHLPLEISGDFYSKVGVDVDIENSYNNHCHKSLFMMHQGEKLGVDRIIVTTTDRPNTSEAANIDNVPLALNNAGRSSLGQGEQSEAVGS